MSDESQLTENGLTTYQVACSNLPPELRESLYRIFARARLPEGDPLWALIAVQIEILHAFRPNGHRSSDHLKPEQLSKLNTFLGDLRAGQEQTDRLISGQFSKLWDTIEAAEKRDAANRATPPRKWKRIAGCMLVGASVIAISFLSGSLVGQRLDAHRVEKTLVAGGQAGPWIAAHRGYMTFFPTADEKGRAFYTLIVHQAGLQAGINAQGEGFINLPAHP